MKLGIIGLVWGSIGFISLTWAGHSPQPSWYPSFFTIGLTLRAEPAYPFIPHFFSLHELAPHQGKGVTIVSFDTPFMIKTTIPSSQASALAHHSVHAWGLIKGVPQLSGLAPLSDFKIIEVFDSAGIVPVAHLNEHCNSLCVQSADIVVLSFQFDPSLAYLRGWPGTNNLSFNPRTLVVAAAGNDACLLAYPRIAAPSGVFSSSSIDVGSFGICHSVPRISRFSQYQPGKGPHLVAPGENIVSSWVFNNTAQKEVVEYGVASGTSIASYIMAGFFALVKGEFGDNFSKKQILAACYGATLRLANTLDWEEKTIFGTVDFRMALYIMHVLLYIKNNFPRYAYCFSQRDCCEDFIKLVMKIRINLLTPLEHYGRVLGLPPHSFAQQTGYYIEKAETTRTLWEQYRNTWHTQVARLSDASKKTAYEVIHHQNAGNNVYEQALSIRITTTLQNVV